MEKPRGYVQLDLFGKAPDVIVDVHEVSAEKRTSITIFLDRIHKRGIEFRVQKLDVGDIILPSEYAVERKSIRDLLRSLTGGRDGRARLFEQMRALAQAYEHPILLIEGGLSVRLDANDGAIYIPIRKKRIRRRIYSVIEERIGVHPNAFLGVIRSIENMGIRVLKSFDAVHGSQILWELYMESKRANRGGREGEPTREHAIIRLKPKLRGLREQQIFFLCGLPGISYVRAVKILRVYKTPFNAIAKVHRWDIDVEGIGEATLEKVHRVLFSEFKEVE